MNANELYLAIEDIEHRKRTANTIPTYALRIAEIFKELKNPPGEIDKALRELLNAGRIEAGRTINDTWIRAK